MKPERVDCLTLKMKPGRNIRLPDLECEPGRADFLILKMKPGIVDCLTLNVSQEERTS